MIDQAAGILRRAKRVSILTGAGISAESGIDTFRGKDGTWSKVDVEAVATPQGFARDPKRVWAWYEDRRVAMKAAEPNPGHRAIARLETLREVTLITQNIDGLHRRAGSRRIVEYHGSLWRVRCMQCGHRGEDDRTPLPEIPPRCECGGLLRPDVVWFGEMIPAQAARDAFEAVQQSDLFLLVGTSAIVTPAADLASLALQLGQPVIEVNLDPTPFSGVVTVSLRGKAGEILPELVEKAGTERADSAQ